MAATHAARARIAWPARLWARPAVRELAALAALALVATLVLWPLAIQGELPRATDTAAFYGPFGSFLGHSLAHGELPLWAPGAFSGQPFAADAQSGVLYPPALAAFGALDPGEALRTLALFHYALALLATYLFARLVGAGRLGACYAAAAYALSSHLLGRSAALGLLGGAAWLPVCLAAAELVVHAGARTRRAAVAALALAIALTVLAGSQQLAALAVAACVLWLALRAGRRGLLEGSLAAAVAVALSAVALLPRLELLRRSTSAGGVADANGIGSLALGDARALIGLHGVSRSELGTLYGGVLTPALALLALLGRRPRSGPLAALAVLAVAWASGLVGWLLAPLPLLGDVASHEPVRAMALAVLAIAVLAGLSLGPLAARPHAAAAVTLALAIGLLVAGTDAVALLYLVPLAAGGAVLLLLRRDRLALALGAPLLLALLALDLTWHRVDIEPRLGWQSVAEASPPPSPTARYLLARQAADGPFRIAVAAPEATLLHQLGGAGSERSRDLMLAQEAMRDGLEDVAGYNPVHLASYSDYLRASNGGRALDRHLEYALRAPTPQLRALGVRYYVSPPGAQPTGLPVVYRDRYAVVTRDDAALPLARVVRPGVARPAGARVLQREPDRVVIETPPGPAGSLVLADVAYPGWHVSVDGRSASAETADGLFRAVRVPPGRHRVVWSFEPASLQRGLAISVVALLALAAVALWPLRRRRRT